MVRALALETRAREAGDVPVGAVVADAAGRVIRDVDATVPTPAWMAERLRRSGVRPTPMAICRTAPCRP